MRKFYIYFVLTFHFVPPGLLTPSIISASLHAPAVASYEVLRLLFC